MNATTLYSLGETPLNGPSMFVLLGLVVAMVICTVLFIQRRRAGTLQPEARVLLLVSMVCLSATIVLAVISLLPDILKPPVVERGRVLRVYTQIIDPEAAPSSRVALSNGADLIIPDVLVPKLQLGICVEMTHTPATDNLLIARRLAPDACLAGGTAG
mgnify:CR=1 FL=1